MLTTSIVRGHVTLDGQPLEGATLVLSGSFSNTALSQADGSFVMGAPDGSYSLKATKSGFLASDPVGVTVPPALPDIHFPFFTASVGGRVSTTGTGEPIAGATVKYTGAFSGNTLTAADGSYSIRHVYGRSASLSVQALKPESHQDSEPQTVAVPPSRSNVDFSMEALIYAIEPLGKMSVGSGSYGTGLNDLGQVVGYIALPGGSGTTYCAFLWQGGLMGDLGTLGGLSWADSINEAGVIVGGSQVSFTGDQHAFICQGIEMKDLGTLGGDFGRARGINNLGLVVGDSHDSAQKLKAFKWQSNVMSALPFLSASATYPAGRAHAVNDLGVVVGMSNNSVSANRPVRWQGSTVSDLGVLPGGVEGCAYDINASGQIAGKSTFNINGSTRAVLWESGTVRDLGTLGGFTSEALGINNLGQVVGKSRVADEDIDPFNQVPIQAFVWKDGVMKNLNKLIRNNIGWIMSEAVAINDRGQILCNAIINPNQPGEEFQTFLLTPVALSGLPNGLPISTQIHAACAGASPHRGGERVGAA